MLCRIILKLVSASKSFVFFNKSVLFGDNLKRKEKSSESNFEISLPKEINKGPSSFQRFVMLIAEPFSPNKSYLVLGKS